MAEIGEAVAVAPPETEQDVQLFSCKWKDCQGQHKREVDPKYPSDGTTEKGRNYEGRWVAAGLEPWVQLGPGTNPNAKRPDFERDFEMVKPKTAAIIDDAVSRTHPEYVTQKHHIISVHLLEDLPDLSKNSELIGYDVNDVPNGICLPYFVVDVVRHDRQCHRGPHPPMYDEAVSDMLRNEQTKCKRYCLGDVYASLLPQRTLIDKLEGISRRVRGHILSWKEGFELRSTARDDRAESFRRIGLEPPP